MIPKTATISYFLARELDQSLKDATLSKIEYAKSAKIFRFLFSAGQKSHLEFSFAPPRFLYLPGWPEKADAFAVWQEATSAIIEHVEGDKRNRIITMKLIREHEELERSAFTIVFELLGAKTNAFLLDSAGVIVQAFRVIADSRQLRPRSPYAPPEPLPDIPSSGESIIFRDRQREYRLRFDGEQYSVLGGSGGSPESSSPLIDLYRLLANLDQTEKHLDDLRRGWNSRIEREIGRLEQLAGRLKVELAACSQSAAYSSWGDLLMGNPHVVPVDDAVMVTDYYSGNEVTVKLLPGKSVIESASAYYKTAKKLQRAEPQLRTRLRSLEERVQFLDAARSSLAGLASEEAIEKLAQELKLDSAKQRPGIDKPEEARAYHTYRTSSGEKVLVGKNAEGNDELTFRVARTYDYWFHTQQSPGSHVILVVPDKNREPSRESIEEAARIAAFYSDMRRASHVPVIYTRRRYVRKVRKGGPGQVIYENVTSLFVDPALPPQGKSLD